MVITLSGSDSDTEDGLTFIITSVPTLGDLYMGEGTIGERITAVPYPLRGNSTTYLASYGSTGADSFTFRVNDGFSDSNEAVVGVTLPANWHPVAYDEVVMTDADALTLLTLSGSDPEECDLIFGIVDDPRSGEIGVIVDQPCSSGTPNIDSAGIIYTPNAGFTGIDHFTFQVGDGTQGHEVTARVTIGVATQVLELKRGWNLVSLAVEPITPAPEDVFKDVGSFSIFAWDATAQRYEVPEELMAGEGYWVAVLADATQVIEGPLVRSYTTDLPKGWTLLGSTFTAAQVRQVSGGSMAASLFEWDADAQRYLSTTVIRPGAWLLARRV